MGHEHQLGPSCSLQGQYLLKQLGGFASDVFSSDCNSCCIDEGVAVRKCSSILISKPLRISPARFVQLFPSIILFVGKTADEDSTK